MAYFSKDYLQFFKELAANNHKEWFDMNRKRYETEVKKAFSDFVQDLIEEVKKDDPRVDLEPKDAIFRINRDIRFSNDKSPYKIQMSAVVGPGGKKDKTSPGIYVELTPEHVRVYGGVYITDKDQLQSIRSYIAAHLDDFERIIGDSKFRKYFGEIRGEQNKVVPKEFKEVAEKQPLILNKQFYYFGQMEAEAVLKEDLIKRIMEHYHASKDIKEFLTKALAH